MKVSIIVPVYNVETYLNECVESLLSQNIDDYEILLIDDGSTDSSSEICDEYSNNNEIVKAFHKDNGGLSSARNYGLERAQGDWVIFVDSDDYWMTNDVLQTLLKIVKDTSSSFIRFEYTAVDEHGSFLYQHSYDKKTSLINKTLTQYELFHLGIAGEFFTPLYMAKRELFKNLRFSEDRKFQEDIDFCLRLFATESFFCSYCPTRFYAYRKRRYSITSTPIIYNLKASFSLADVFAEYSLIIQNKQLQAEYQYYSVMMYYWTLCTFLEPAYFKNRRMIFRQLNVAFLQRVALKRMLRYKIFNKSSLLIAMSPNLSIVLLYMRVFLLNIKTLIR